jgi:hypothetical protein
MSDEAFNVASLRERIRRGDYLVKSHALQHRFKEGFTIENIVEAALNGKVIEQYPDEMRLLICGQASLLDTVRIYLHIVCEYTDPIYLEFITAYIPDEAYWQNPPFKRRKKRK